ncbi:hypothetical protein A3C59_02640 [Candidatus Daviesbacteria bacterium RIFCSPHIGHO2_02_FULL_36_13]|uniref:Aspartyl/glutamyl-tRNA(Asn/Gln) amidotransferase subunit C n=1 Tax=Candidatus Daviesbacteria bacterium RIFCSPHIGHO2_02_FULL_36_13 TaxID=1797768 RepID=A0A1F5JSI2_9BACT|nr:MAG: hypothetical protein A3C59_02640 [Candidatus Daviesbacteria bacterium RIFCSPHIGHO2_02_FULL_36_13]OGE44100.1 MAG: hypothetical protein A3A45_02145 [Candidatus Daviesbacteria bacterium RIFCSPLOWO2_01_FULL_36_8]
MKIDVKRVAKLASLPLSEAEEEKYSKQLSKILDYIEQLNEVDTLDVEPTFNVTGLSNAMREDQVGDCTIPQEEAISNAPVKKDGFIVTKGVFNE